MIIIATGSVDDAAINAVSSIPDSDQKFIGLQIAAPAAALCYGYFTRQIQIFITIINLDSTGIRFRFKIFHINTPRNARGRLHDHSPMYKSEYYR